MPTNTKPNIPTPIADAPYPGYGPYVFYGRDRLGKTIVEKSAGYELKRRVVRRRVNRLMEIVAPRAWEICRNGIFYGWVDQRDGGWFWTLPNGCTGWHGPFRTRRDAVIARSNR